MLMLEGREKLGDDGMVWGWGLESVVGLGAPAWCVPDDVAMIGLVKDFMPSQTVICDKLWWWCWWGGCCWRLHKRMWAVCAGRAQKLLDCSVISMQPAIDKVHMHPTATTSLS